MEIFIDNILYIVVFVTIVTFVFAFINKARKPQITEYRNFSHNEIEIRLRAYERLILFLERIEPVSMINRLELHSQSVDFITSSLIKNIVLEYEYNISQQIYVSDQVWKSIELIKNKLINSISHISKNLPQKASVDDLVKKLLNDTNSHMMLDEIKKMLKDEVRHASKI